MIGTSHLTLSFHSDKPRFAVVKKQGFDESLLEALTKREKLKVAKALDHHLKALSHFTLKNPKENARDSKNAKDLSELVHEARVRTKKARAMLKWLAQANPNYKRDLRPLRERLRNISTALREHRDRDARIESLLKIRGLRQHYPELERNLKSEIETSKSARLKALKDTCRVARKAQREFQKVRDRHSLSQKASLRKVIAKTRTKLVEFDRQHSDKALHSVRKRLKEFQYLIALEKDLSEHLGHQVEEIATLIGDSRDLNEISKWKQIKVRDRESLLKRSRRESSRAYRKLTQLLAQLP